MCAQIQRVPVGFFNAKKDPPKDFKKYGLHQEYQSLGSFWIPDRTDHKCYGVLECVPGLSPSLSLIGEPWEIFNTGHGFIAVIHGRLKNNYRVTLLNCRFITTESYNKKRKESFLSADVVADMVLFGVLAQDYKTINLISLRVYLSHLNEWMESPTNCSLESDRHVLEINTNVRKQYTVFYDGTEINIIFGTDNSVIGAMRGKTTRFEYQYYLEIRPQGEKPFSWFENLFKIIRNFISYLVGNGVYTLDLMIKMEEKQGHKSIFLRTLTPSTIRTNSYYFSTVFEKFEKNFERTLQNWCDSYDLLRNVIETHSNISRSEGYSIQVLFLQIVQCLEHFHGVLFPTRSRYFKPPKWSEIDDNIKNSIADIPEGTANDCLESADKDPMLILRGRIGSLNNRSFESRLKDMFLCMEPKHLVYLIYNPDDYISATDQLVKKIARTRHFLTHYRRSLEKKILDNDGLAKATISCWAIINHWIAIFIGLDEDSAHEIATKAREPKFIVDTEFDF